MYQRKQVTARAMKHVTAVRLAAERVREIEASARVVASYASPVAPFPNKRSNISNLGWEVIK